MKKVNESRRIQRIEKKWKSPITQLLHHWHWDENLKHSEIASRIEVPRTTTTRWFRYYNIPTQSAARFTNLNLLNVGTRKSQPASTKTKREFPWHFNKDFFKTWSSDMAYVLGFIMADGYVFTNPRGSCYTGFVSDDLEIIEKIRLVLHSNHFIGTRNHPSNPKWKPTHVLQIGSKDLFQDLKKFGVVPNKSLILKFPANIPDAFVGHFVRGYFDGDGCVYFRKHLRKDRNKMSWVFTVRFTSGSKQFLEGLHEILKKYTNGGFIQIKNRGYDLVFSHRDGFALFDLMYKDIESNLFLERKYNIFQKAITTLREK